MDDPTDGVWDDGEWISWDYINESIHDQEIQRVYPLSSPKIIKIFHDLILAAEDYKSYTGRYLQIWGELGELYAEIKFGVNRHRPGAQGSDGTIGNDHVEVKTISPEKGHDKVLVKRAGNFNKLLIVKVSEDFNFEARMIDRKEIKKGTGKHARVAWSSTTE